MPHKNYCQQCGKSITDVRNHPSNHTVIKDVSKGNELIYQPYQFRQPNQAKKPQPDLTKEP